MTGRKAQKEILQAVRTNDPDRYLATLFAPSETIPHLMALYAFNCELVKIPSHVSDPMLGEIRLQWWRDVLHAMEKGEETGHPIADAFGSTIRRFDLPHFDILGLIDARSFDISQAVMPDTQALNTYLGKTEGTLFKLACHILGGEQMDNAEQAARLAGSAYGRMDILRTLARSLAQGRVPLPASSLMERGFDPQILTAREPKEKWTQDLRDIWKWVLAESITDIQKTHAEAERAMRSLPGQLRPAFLPLALIAPHLKSITKVGHDPLTMIASIYPLHRIWRLWRAFPSFR